MKGIKMLKSRIFSLVMLVSISACMAPMLVAKQELSFATIGTLHMRSFGLDLNTEKKEEELKDIDQMLSVRLNDDDKRRLVYQICARHEHNVEDDINLKTLVDDLDVFYGHGQNSQDTIFNRLFEGNIRTFMGEAMAAKRVARVVSDKKQLNDYQECVAEFTSNEGLFKKVDALLERIARSEANMLSFWQEENPATTKLVNQLYFGKRLALLNKDANVLEASSHISRGSQLIGVFYLPALYTLIPYVTLKISNYIASKLGASTKDMKSQSFKECSQNAFDFFYNPMPAIKDIKHQYTAEGYQERDAEIRKVINGVHESILSELNNAKTEKDIEYWEKALKNISEMDLVKSNYQRRKINIAMDAGICAFKAYQVFRLALNAKGFVSDIVQKRDTANFLQSRLISVAEYLRAIKELHELAVENPCLEQVFPIEQVYGRLFNSQFDDVNKLVNLLMTKTFVGEASFFSRSGRVLVAHTLMNKVKGEFLDCMQLIGEVDAAVAVAKLYTSFAGNDKATYSFAEYATQNRPYMQAVDFWNPLVDPRVVVTNNMQLGQEGAVRNIILTGSNRGGKSTLLKATMLNALLAQTITVVPAKRYVATPFACLATYLNVTDDTAAGLSLFQAQVVRAKKLVEMIDALSPEQLGFVIIDEIFTGTGSKKASSAAFKVAEHMAQSDYLCFILATHFVDELTKLEEETHGLCKNFKVDADKDENGSIVFRHKLEEGVSTQNIANELLNDEFESIDFGPDKVAVA
jgi:hypothetical protein